MPRPSTPRFAPAPLALIVLVLGAAGCQCGPRYCYTPRIAPAEPAARPSPAASAARAPGCNPSGVAWAFMGTAPASMNHAGMDHAAMGHRSMGHASMGHGGMENTAAMSPWTPDRLVRKERGAAVNHGEMRGAGMGHAGMAGMSH